MKAKIEIPKGWRRLEPGSTVRVDDKILADWYGDVIDSDKFTWRDVDSATPIPVGHDELIIRRVVKAKARKK